MKKFKKCAVPECQADIHPLCNRSIWIIPAGTCAYFPVAPEYRTSKKIRCLCPEHADQYLMWLMSLTSEQRSAIGEATNIEEAETHYKELNLKQRN